MLSPILSKYEKKIYIVYNIFCDCSLNNLLFLYSFFVFSIHILDFRIKFISSSFLAPGILFMVAVAQTCNSRRLGICIYCSQEHELITIMCTEKKTSNARMIPYYFDLYLVTLLSILPIYSMGLAF